MTLSVVLALSLSITAAAAPPHHATNTAHRKNTKPGCKESLRAINFYRKEAWKWESYFQLRKTIPSRARVPEDACGYAQWVAKKWRARATSLRSWSNQLEHAERDFTKAAKIATVVFPRITVARLWYRASVEGGHGSWYCNRSGSGACGWFQFMEGTFYGRANGAFDIARKRGFPIPDKFKSWHSMIGQNLTAAYMFDLGLECSGEGWAASC